MRLVEVPLGNRRYSIKVGSGLLPRLGGECAALKLGQRCVVITDSNVVKKFARPALKSLAASGFEPLLVTVPAGEKSKRLAVVEQCYDRLAAHRLERKSFIVALGGGVVGDLAGFVAATYLRGIPFVQVPTTFLAQVDSSVGGKTGVNLAEGKNLVGSFHQPRAVFADIGVLSTLPDRELHAGLMESVKAGIIRDRALVRYMEAQPRAVLGRDPKALEKVIAASIRMKAGVVARDERESGLRMILNFGHTVGHALEQVSGFKLLLHGEAVGWGMIAALAIARQRGTISHAQQQRMEELVHLYGPLPPIKMRVGRVVAASGSDKKNVGGVRRFVVPIGLGDAGVIEDVTEAELEAAVGYMLARAAQPRG